jgi:hypothetical protein
MSTGVGFPGLDGFLLSAGAYMLILLSLLLMKSLASTILEPTAT